MITTPLETDLFSDAAILDQGWSWVGNLHRADGGPVVDASLRFLDEADLDEMYRLHRMAIETLPTPELFRADSIDFMAGLIREHGRVCGVVCAGRLIAYCGFSFPKAEDDNNIGRDLCLPDSELNLVVQCDGAAVHPDARGYGLQRLTGALRNAYARRLGYRHLVGTVSPRNMHSLYNCLSLGMTLRGLKTKFGAYGGAMRWLAYRALSGGDAPIDPATLTEAPLSDTEAQSALLDQGYWGVALVRDDPPRLVFGRAASV